MQKQYWLVKVEPEDYAWEDLVRDGETVWSGVRNYQARNNLRAMKAGDLVFFYQSVKNPQLRGVAKVARTAYADPTDADGKWSAVNIAHVGPLPRPVPLADVRAEPSLSTIALIRQSRLSVMPLSPEEFAKLLDMGGYQGPFS